MGLTPKRRAFVNAIVSGMNPSEAYRAAGYSERMGARSVAVEANKLMRNPDISLAILKGQAEAVKKAIWSRETALERLDEVNSIALGAMRETGVTDRDNLAGFTASFDRLEAMTDGGGAVSDVPRFYFERKADAPVLVLGVEPKRVD